MCDGRFERVVILDFGVAHREGRTPQSVLTLAGAVVGTLSYMAPEQARADGTIGAAADIYAVGRVIHLGLSERFREERQHVAAMLARALFEVEPPLNQICPWVPTDLSGLVSRMLAKEPEARPADGAALLAELRELAPLTNTDSGSVAPAPPQAEAEEQRLYSIVLAVPEARAVPDSHEISSEVMRADMDERRALQRALHRHSAQSVWLLDGSLLVTLPTLAAAHDQVAQAARSALLIKSVWPTALVAVATGRGLLSGRTVIGEVVDRAASLIQAQFALSQENPKDMDAEPESVWVDALSASLLTRRFELVAFSGGALLRRELKAGDELQPVMGPAAPCIGRETELTILDAVLNRCAAESEAEAVLITAGPGFGKTRLRQEFVARARKHVEGATVLVCVGDVLSTGAPYSLLKQGLRRLCRISPAMNGAAARQALSRFCTSILGPAGQLTAMFLGELSGLPFPDAEAPELRKARSDPKGMIARISQAFIDFLSALCQRSQVLWVLDDLQWGDFMSVQMVGNALHELAAQPLMVVALGRPEIMSLFPKIRQWPHVKEFPLAGLSRAASERIVRFVLGSDSPAAVVARIAEQAAGNVLLLEELIRAEREHHGEPIPATVLAILQARMQQLEPRLRLLIGRASILGNRFWRGGLQALLEDTQSEELDAQLRALVRAELITAHSDSHLKGEVEYSFRHPLKREAAYGLLMDDQKRRWHRIAGQYLERAGEQEALVLAEHFSRSDEPQRAVSYFARAAALALDGNDLALARRCIDRALAIDPAEASVRGELLGILAAILNRNADPVQSFEIGQQALPLLRAGSVLWCRTMHALLATSLMLGRKDANRALIAMFLSCDPAPEALIAYLETGTVLLNVISLRGDREMCQRFLARLQALAAASGETETRVTLYLRHGQQRIARMLEGNPWVAWRHAQAASEAAQRGSNQRYIGYMQAEAALAELELGSVTFEAGLRSAMALLRSIEEIQLHDYAAINLALWHTTRAEGLTKELAAESEATARLTLARHTGNVLLRGFAELTLSRLSQAQGALPEAERLTRLALTSFEGMPPVQLAVFGQLVGLLLAQGPHRAPEALALARKGMEQLASLGGAGFRDLSLRLAFVEALRAAGEGAEADVELSTAQRILEQRAADIADESWRQRYLENISDNARLRALGPR